MGNKKIKVKYVDYWEDFNLQDDLTFKWLNEHYDVVIDDDPEYIFYSCFGYEFLKYDCIRIFYTGENVAPDFNECDYSLSFEKIKFDDRNLVFPNFLFYRKELDIISSFNENPIIEKNLANRKFCSFVVSNGLADPIREKIFELLSEYKQVDSGGKFKNNIGGAVKNKLKFQSEYKFALSFENASHPGYTTEKILQAFASKCVPIYWGDPQVYDYYNKDAFINLNEFKSIEQMIDYIIKIDKNDELYLEYLRKPIWSNNEIYESKIKEFNLFMQNIFEQSYNLAFRRSRSNMNLANEERMLMWREAYIKNENNFIYRSGKRVKNKIKGILGI